MFQRGVDLPTLDTSYISSVSWYFLLMFGLRGTFRLLIGDSHIDERRSLEIQGELGMAFGNSQPFNKSNAFKSECENLEFCRYKSVIDESERRLLGKDYPKNHFVSVGASGGGSSGGGNKKKGRNKADDIFGDALAGGGKKKN